MEKPPDTDFLVGKNVLKFYMGRKLVEYRQDSLIHYCE